MIAFSLFVMAMTKTLKSWKNAIWMGIVLGTAIYLIRMLPDLFFGIHTLMLVSLAVVLYRLVLDTDLAKIIVAACTGMLLLVFVEYLFFWLAINFTGLTLEELISDSLWWIVLRWPHIIIMLGIAYFFHKKQVAAKGCEI